MKKLFKCILTILTGNPSYMFETYQCPYCNYSTDSYYGMRSHLTYFHWMCVPAVDQVMKELKENSST